MEKIKSHLLARLCWLAFGIVMGASRFVEGIQEHSNGKTLTGLAWLLLGALWFLSPLIIGKRNDALVDRQRQAAIGSDRLRNRLMFAAVGCMAAGLVLRYGFAN